jgi:phospholipid:diacylglycerol acyltransferase
MLGNLACNLYLDRLQLVLERFFSKKERRKLFRSWAGSASMWIKVLTLKVASFYICLHFQGGNMIWGNETFAPDDEFGAAHSHGQLIGFREGADISPGLPSQDGSEQTPFKMSEAPNPLTVPANLTADQAGIWILEHTPATFQVRTLSPEYIKLRALTCSAENDGNQLLEWL